MERLIGPERMGTKREDSKKIAKEEIVSYYEDKFQSRLTQEELIGASNEIEDDNDSQEIIPEGLISTDIFFQENGDELSEQIHSWYENAMARRNRDGLEYGIWKI